MPLRPIIGERATAFIAHALWFVGLGYMKPTRVVFAERGTIQTVLAATQISTFPINNLSVGKLCPAVLARGHIQVRQVYAHMGFFIHSGGCVG